jgi:hypothetical protein
MSEEQLAQRVKTERGRTIRHSQDEVDLALSLLATNGGSYKPTVEALEEEGITDIPREKLRNWRDNAFPRRYTQLRRELGRDVGENVAGRALERAMQADEATQAYVEEALAKVGSVSPAHLAKNAASLADVMSKNVQISQLLRDRPTEIKEVRTVDVLVKNLEQLGVVKKEPAITVEVESEEDVAS